MSEKVEDEITKLHKTAFEVKNRNVEKKNTETLYYKIGHRLPITLMRPISLACAFSLLNILFSHSTFHL